MIQKIISGGQNGVDQGALDFAMANGIDAGGWCPKGRICETGAIPEKYPLEEVEVEDYKIRTLMNIRDSEGTLVIIRNGFMEKGTTLTIDYCKQLKKPYFLLDMSLKQKTGRAIKMQFIKWLEDHSIQILNVAGNRESNSPGIGTDTFTILKYLLRV